nr:hypothetical protein [uncultured Roseateles sp.]
MRPPDNLSTLKGTPVAMAIAGVLIVPAMWAFLLAQRIVLAVAPFNSA